MRTKVMFMTKFYFLPIVMAALAAAGVAEAEELGRVISSTPVVQQVGVPRQVCTTEQVVSEAPKSGAGAVIGAVAGAVLGHTVGGGSGQVLATGVGMIGGAAVGDHLEGSRNQAKTVQRCSNQTFYENRTVAYNVVYEYGGKQFSVQMPQDPGPYVRLQITPVGGTAQPPQAPVPTSYVPAAAPVQVSSVTTVVESAPVYVAAAQVPVVYAPAYPAYHSYYPPVGLSVNLGYSNVRHRHWR